MNKDLSNEEMLWQLIDFDKVLALSSGYPDFLILGPVPGAVEGMAELNKRGWKVVVYTARPWADYHKVEAWLRKHKVKVRRIICGKVLGQWLLDDRAIEFNTKRPKQSWERALKKIGHKV